MEQEGNLLISEGNICKRGGREGGRPPLRAVRARRGGREQHAKRNKRFFPPRIPAAGSHERELAEASVCT